MDTKYIVLTSEEWDRVIELLDTRFNQHPDTIYLLTKITNQLAYNPADVQSPLPSPATFSNPSPETIEKMILGKPNDFIPYKKK